ncbi:NADP-dependent glyceraldehyde-3-phosphate dehydrogenase [Fusobacterium sp.]|uniref:NADP-dependent glyceraldehyde-3-phosphate dehydrogenase n=1 Tax=Fusobacterium sp. TaxID=68766 RepID=UPI0025BCA57A|nr:NADP-dependent glyceraldehyde-3-phosphate dehydrogenase [Fusobacterium sp.]MCI5725381.1 NADP-dependent glyceraldehyde-3-phosphate dehydrogenase [Fusobacterium sp.]
MQYKNLVNGEWVSSEKVIKINSPINNEEIGTIPAMTKEEADNAIKTAKIALKKWKNLAVVERAKYLYKAADILERDKDIIGNILAKEVSKGIKAAIGEVVRTADLIRYSAEEGLRTVGEIVEGGSFEAASKNKIAMVRREPMGLILAIAPFNYPVNLSASKIAPALIGGNVVLFKPPTQGAISALLLIKAFYEAGIPAGVINTVTGRGSEIGDYLIEHPMVDFVNFTGSTGVGKRIGELAGMRPILLELGGKDGAIVAEDADLEKTAKDIVSGAFSYSGQRCTAIKRVLVVEEVADKLVQLIKIEVEKLKVGNPFENADITPLIDNKSADFIETLIKDALDKGAKALTPVKREGNLLWPVLFDEVTLDMQIAWEEPFGPILPIIRVKDVEEAIEICNTSEYGLQTSVFTRDIMRAFDIAKRLEVGTVQINNKTQRGPDNFPFLGIKGSGVGVQGIKYSIESMTKIKSIVIDW